MKNKGFTMVELMIVIAIIAVLASIIMPKMSGARQKANLNACMQNVRQIGLAMEMYAQDNNGFHTPYTDGAPHYAFVPNYLIPGYIRAVPTCPTGHSYWVAANMTNGSYSSHQPSPADLVISICGPGSGYDENAHPGLSRWCPQYVVGGTKILLTY